MQVQGSSRDRVAELPCEKDGAATQALAGRLLVDRPRSRRICTSLSRYCVHRCANYAVATRANGTKSDASPGFVRLKETANDTMLVTAALLALVSTATIFMLIWRRRHFSYFEKLGIPGPKPNLIWGNIREYHSMPHYKVLEKWFRQYGDVFGFYNGDVPFVVLKDLDFAEYIGVRNFQNFMDRSINMPTDSKHPILGRSVMHERAPRWKSIRGSVAYGFSTAKLKLLMPSIKEKADMFLKLLDEHADSGEEVNMTPKYEELAMEYVTRGLFGLDERFFGKPDHPLIAVAKAAFRGVMTGSLHVIAQSTTMFGSLMKPFYFLTHAAGEFTFQTLSDETEKIVNIRRKNPAYRRPDMLQNLLEAEYTEEPNGLSSTAKPNGDNKTRPLTVQEVVVNAATLFVSGFETMATSLSYLTFALAKHPDIQEKVRKEASDALSASGSLDYELVTRRLKYLGQVIDETLRRYPPATTSITRQAKEDFVYNGTKFKAGTCFMIPAYHLHMEPRFWLNPEELDPERVPWI
ncbi:cytochrome P450 6B1-like isoform X2 [Dermacentor silvarum]|uniref:cytochrome P450 6B1-like isoform X2 n=1 Tax=Dermacentor silvarum TaxID=543639 RepID=UPI0021007C6C|nr:cytochrome P450 6B1-like isoform X2 [Dermacentor silvarum]